MRGSMGAGAGGRDVRAVRLVRKEGAEGGGAAGGWNALSGRGLGMDRKLLRENRRTRIQSRAVEKAGVKPRSRADSDRKLALRSRSLEGARRHLTVG